MLCPQSVLSHPDRDGTCVPVDACMSSPCLHGNCVTSGPGDFYCDCQPGYSGDICGHNVDDCESAPCGPGTSMCVDEINGYSCLCLPGYEGKVLGGGGGSDCGDNITII